MRDGIAAPAAPVFFSALFELIKIQLSAAAFGVGLLALIVLSWLFWPSDAALPRYDALLIASILIQAFLLAKGWETWEEAKVIAAFHVVGVAMEIFKTAAGAWVYPEFCYLRLGGVPLFTGFMYSAVGSYIARSWRGMDLRFSNYPPFMLTIILATLIYINFYSHHYIADWRWALFICTGALFGPTWAHGRLGQVKIRFPLLGMFLGIAVLIWTAENIATWANVWIYPTQEKGWELVPVQKLNAWFLLMIVSFVLVSALHRPDKKTNP